MTDDLDDLLAPTPAPIDPAAKEALFRRTARALARGRAVRRVAAVAAVGLAFAAGVGVGWVGKPDPDPPAPVREIVPIPIPVPVPAGGSPGEAVQLAAADLELEAEKATDRAVSARLFRQAGDRYLAEGSDIASATRCYAHHLAEAGPGVPAVATDDSWLLIRMKASRTKETERESSTGT